MKNILLIGLGRFGKHIALQLNKLGHEVMAVDSNEERINEILPIVTNAQIGDSTNTEFLKSLGIGNFDVCIVTIGGNFQNSLETTSLLKELGAKLVVSRAERDVQAKFLLRNGADEIADKYIELLQIKTASRETLIGQLSGGNQQMVILARWLATDPEFLILDEPTRGIDVGTKTEIQKLVIELADQGKSLIFISSEIEEMLRTCSKLVVLRDGQEVGEITEELTQGHVMQSIAGGGRNE